MHAGYQLEVERTYVANDGCARLLIEFLRADPERSVCGRRFKLRREEISRAIHLYFRGTTSEVRQRAQIRLIDLRYQLRLCPKLWLRNEKYESSTVLAEALDEIVEILPSLGVVEAALGKVRRKWLFKERQGGWAKLSLDQVSPFDASEPTSVGRSVYYFEAEVSSVGLLSEMESAEWFTVLKRWMRLAEPEDAKWLGSSHAQQHAKPLIFADRAQGAKYLALVERNALRLG